MTLDTRTIASLTTALALALPSLAAQAALVGHWGFEDAGGVAIVDSAVAGNGGLLVNGQAGTRVAGLVGQALQFDGSTGPASPCVMIADSPSLDLSSALSFAAWVKPDGDNRDAPVFAKAGYSRSARVARVAERRRSGLLVRAVPGRPLRRAARP